MVAGKFTGKKELVKTMVEDGPSIVKWLLEMGSTSTGTSRGISPPGRQEGSPRRGSSPLAIIPA